LYGEYVKAKLPDTPVIWDSVDCISYLFKQASSQNAGGFGKFITRFELGRTQRMEGKLIGKFDHVIVTSETDRLALLELVFPVTATAPIDVLPNGVDLAYFHPNLNLQRSPETLVFSGKMSYHANVSMVKYLVGEIMPRVWKNRPSVRLKIVGKDPTFEVRAMGSDPRIEVTGTVDDIRPYLWKAALAVVPLVYGAGIQNKILEAMACGTPVITTPRTLSSLHVKPGRQLLVADQTEDFSQQILSLLEDQRLQKRIGSAGAAYVRDYHNWTVITNQLLLYYTNALQKSIVQS
jgi:glycosyltransferase involved in cell wall biosynthesis